MTKHAGNRLAVATLLVSLALALGAAEWGLGRFAPLYLVGIQEAFQYDPDLGYRFKPGIHRFKLTDHLEEVRTNAIGSVNFAESLARYPALVFAAGDSYTQGTGNPSDTAYPFQLDLLLNEDGDGFYRERYGVVNLGLAAFGTEQSLIALKRYAEIIGRPRYILYLGCDNDWDDDVLFRNGYRHRHLVDGSPRWGILVGPALWLGEFELVKRAKVALAEVRHARMMSDAAPVRSEGEPEPSVAERVWPVLERIVALSREWDATLVLSWANPGTISYAWLRSKAAEEQIPFADWVPAVESVREKLPGLPFANSHSGGHWRPWANAVIARSYARAMGVWSPGPVEEPQPRNQ